MCGWADLTPTRPRDVTGIIEPWALQPVRAIRSGHTRRRGESNAYGFYPTLLSRQLPAPIGWRLQLVWLLVFSELRSLREAHSFGEPRETCSLGGRNESRTRTGALCPCPASNRVPPPIGWPFHLPTRNSREGEPRSPLLLVHGAHRSTRICQPSCGHW